MADDAPAYFDNNTTTMAPEGVVDAMVRWLNRGDPAAGHAAAQEARRLIRRFRRHLAAEGGFELEGPRGFSLVFTSGGSEANAFVLTAAARAYARRTKKMPHIITGAAEHRSVLGACLALARDKMIQLTVLPVRKAGPRSGGLAGTVDPKELQNALRPNTALVSLMAVNGETGGINDVRALGEIAHANKIPFHSDVAQLFGRSVFRPGDLNLDAFSVSFHKLHGPPGVGLLGIRNDFLEGYGLGAMIPGPQNGGLRGGIENVAGIAGALAAYKLAMTDRRRKTAQIRRLRDGILKDLAGRFPVVNVDEYCEARPRVPDGDPMTPRSSRVLGDPKTARGVEVARMLDVAAEAGLPAIVLLGPSDRSKLLPNTILLSVLRTEGAAHFDAERARAALEAARVLVGTHALGNAPDAPAENPSHVVEAMDVPPELWPGVVRVSLSDYTSEADAALFVRRFAEVAVAPKSMSM